MVLQCAGLNFLDLTEGEPQTIVTSFLKVTRIWYLDLYCNVSKVSVSDK